MSGDFLKQLEDKVLALVNEVESLRSQLSQVQSDNEAMKRERIESRQKLEGLISLLDSVEKADCSTVQEKTLFKVTETEEAF